MTSDNIAGHTAAQNTLGEDGLRDGDSLSPATLTNLIQGVQGNGILRYQDGAYGSTRNETNSGNQPASMVRASSSTLTVSGGFVVLDGALYEFGGGVGNTITLDLNDGSHGTGALQLSANEEAIYTIYVAPSGGNSKVHYEGGSPVDTTTGLYPSASNQYLIDYDTGATQDNMKTVVLAHVRVQFVSTGGGSNKLNITEINDKRVFVGGAADYRVPLSVGTISSGEIADGGAEGINTIAHLNAVHNENGELTTSDTINAHWVSHPRYGSFNQSPPSSSDAGYGQGPSRGADRGGGHAADSFYFAGRNNEQTGHYSVRLQGRGVDATSTALTTSGTWTVTADGDSFFMLSPNSGVTITLQPQQDASSNYMFPEGHMIEVCNDGLGNIVFDDLSGANETVSPSHRATFIYEGSVWVRCDYQSAIVANSPAIKESSGTPSFNTGVTQASILTLLGIETGATADQTDAEIRAAVEAATDSNVFTDADHTKLNGIEASADVTDATNVKSALNGMTLSDIGTPASNDKVLIQDASDSDNIKYADFSEFGGGSSYTDADAIAAVEGESTLDLTGQVTMSQDLQVQGVQYQQFKDLTDDLATGYHTIAVVEGRSGGSASGTGGSDQRAIGTFLIRNTDSSRHQTIALTASHLFGGGNGNGISVEHSSYYSTIGISDFRIKENSTYDGAVLQINIADATNNIEVYLKNNFQEAGWQLIQAVADATDPSTATLGVGYNNAYSSFTASATTSISDIAQLGQHIQGPLVCKDDLTVDTDTLVVDASSNKVGVGTASPAQALHVSGTIRQTNATSAVLVADANGDISAASNLTDQTYSTSDTTDAVADVYTPGTAPGLTGPVATRAAGAFAAPPPATVAEALDRIAAALADPTFTVGSPIPQ